MKHPGYKISDHRNLTGPKILATIRSGRYDVSLAMMPTRFFEGIPSAARHFNTGKLAQFAAKALPAVMPRGHEGSPLCSMVTLVSVANKLYRLDSGMGQPTTCSHPLVFGTIVNCRSAEDAVALAVQAEIRRHPQLGISALHLAWAELDFIPWSDFFQNKACVTALRLAYPEIPRTRGSIRLLANASIGAVRRLDRFTAGLISNPSERTTPEVVAAAIQATQTLIDCKRLTRLPEIGSFLKRMRQGAPASSPSGFWTAPELLQREIVAIRRRAPAIRETLVFDAARAALELWMRSPRACYKENALRTEPGLPALVSNPQSVTEQGLKPRNPPMASVIQADPRENWAPYRGRTTPAGFESRPLVRPRLGLVAPARARGVG